MAPVVGASAAAASVGAAAVGANGSRNPVGGIITSDIPAMGTSYTTSIDVSLRYFGSPTWNAPRITP